MQRYSENCVRGPQASRGLAGACAACCWALRVVGGRAADDCATAAGSAGAAVAAVDGVVRLALAADAGAVAPGDESEAVGSVGAGFAIPPSAAIGALAVNEGAIAPDTEFAAGRSVGTGFTLAMSVPIDGGTGGAGLAAGADTAALFWIPASRLMPSASRTCAN